ncbi:MAG: MFS transporter [Lentisphaerae bacterium]|nr:MFS transporter [Lentisphaerota bacterium]MBT7057609.1 MFS transporter [Lentisphaerota bacterium]MBT7844944.1 MFS transporter [Lentisphaerota bacterium]
MSAPRPAPPSFAKPLYLLSAAFFFIFMGAGAQQAYLVPYLQDVAGWTRLQASTVVACVYFSMVLFRPANLYLFSSWSDRRFTMVGSLTYLWFTISMLLTAYLKSYPLALASAWLWGAGAAMMWTGTTMQTLALADEAGGRHGTGMGILYSSTHAGWMSGAILLGKVYEAGGGSQTPMLYIVATGITLIGIGFAFALPPTPGTPRQVPSFRNMLAVMLRRNEAIACVLQFTSALAYGLILGLFTSYVGEVHGREWVWISVALYPATRMVISFERRIRLDSVTCLPRGHRNFSLSIPRSSGAL